MTIFGNTIKEWIIAIVGATLLTVYSAVINTYVLMCIWEWFISIPFGLNTISFKTAMCICIVVGFLTSNGWKYIPTEEIFKYFRHTIFSPLVTLGICYLIHILYING